MVQRILTHITPTRTITVVATTKDQFIKALRTTQRGDHIIYHTGLLIFDRDDANRTPGQLKQIRDLAKAAWKAHLQGEVYLKQRRLQPQFGCEYLAERR